MKKDKRYKHQLSPRMILVIHGFPRWSPIQRKKAKQWLIMLAKNLEKRSESVAEVFTGIYQK